MLGIPTVLGCASTMPERVIRLSHLELRARLRPSVCLALTMEKPLKSKGIHDWYPHRDWACVNNAKMEARLSPLLAPRAFASFCVLGDDDGNTNNTKGDTCLVSPL